MAISKAAVKKLRELWLGEVCVIHLRDMNLVIMDEQQGQVKVAPMIEETVFDIDENYMHLGNIDAGVTKTLPHESVGLIEISLGQIANMIDAAIDGDIH